MHFVNCAVIYSANFHNFSLAMERKSFKKHFLKILLYIIMDIWEFLFLLQSEIRIKWLFLGGGQGLHHATYGISVLFHPCSLDLLLCLTRD